MGGRPERSKTGLKSGLWWPGILVSAGIAGALLLIFGRVPLVSYDVTYALSWGQELASGDLPTYDSIDAPTPHPLSVALAGLASPLGLEGAYDVMRIASLLSFGALAWIVFLLGWESFGWPVGAAAALLVAVNPVLLDVTVAQFHDVSFVALVLGAVLVEVRNPRSGTVVMSLVAIAGLLRPEAWLLGGIYWVYLAPGLSWEERGRYGALAAAAPALWLLSDWVITGDPLFTAHQTHRIAEIEQTSAGLSAVPRAAQESIRGILWAPELVAAPLGLLIALQIRRRVALLLIAVAAAISGMFVVFGALGQPLLYRFLLLPAIVLILFAAVAVAGWLSLEAGGRRRLLCAAAAGVIAVFAVVKAGSEVDTLQLVQETSERSERLLERTRDIVRAEPERFALCTPIYTALIDFKSQVAYYAERPPEEVRLVTSESPREGLVVVPVGLPAGYYDKTTRSRLRALPSHGFHRVAANSHFAVLAHESCRKRTRASQGPA